MTEEQVEKILLEYREIEKLIEALERSAEKMTLKKIALSLGPSDTMTQDITKPRVQTTHQDWLYNFGRACDILLKHQTEMGEEYERYIERRAEIWGMIANADLENREREYVILRYVEGLRNNEISSYEHMNASRPSLNELRRSALKKIAEGMR